MSQFEAFNNLIWLIGHVKTIIVVISFLLYYFPRVGSIASVGITRSETDGWLESVRTNLLCVLVWLCGFLFPEMEQVEGEKAITGQKNIVYNRTVHNVQSYSSSDPNLLREFPQNPESELLCTEP